MARLFFPSIVNMFVKRAQNEKNVYITRNKIMEVSEEANVNFQLTSDTKIGNTL